MEKGEKLKEIVREKYTDIANQSKEVNEASCCGAGDCCTVDYAVFAEDYSKLKGYNSDADLGLGCGIPTEFAQIKEGNTVLDLGSGAGNDCFVARELAGPTGKVIGLDMTDIMIEKARLNADKLGFNNVEFRKGDIEQMPIGGNSIDVVISNCVLNLVPNKEKAFSETYRVLKPGGHFSVSDVVLKGELPDALKNDAEMYAGCVSGAIQGDDYLAIIQKSGFSEITVQKQKVVNLPDEILDRYLTDAEKLKFQNGEIGIFSVTVYAQKPETMACEPGSGCC
ncbi:MAG: arsenite methyltransferase [Flavobacteriales bacterium]|nr:arsenite methyltransferase [Flavobacteriales bacterium]